MIHKAPLFVCHWVSIHGIKCLFETNSNGCNTCSSHYFGLALRSISLFAQALCYDNLITHNCIARNCSRFEQACLCTESDACALGIHSQDARHVYPFNYIYRLYWLCCADKLCYTIAKCYSITSTGINIRCAIWHAPRNHYIWNMPAVCTSSLLQLYPHCIYMKLLSH